MIKNLYHMEKKSNAMTNSLLKCKTHKKNVIQNKQYISPNL